MIPVLLGAHEVGPPESAAAAQEPLTTGRIELIEPDRGAVLVKHGSIPGLGMPAMTMRFQLADAAWGATLHAGEVVRFRAERRHGTLVITQIRRP